ncbi:hydroxymethylbilane synthase [Serinicoccus chungangensis]|uniref:Porphobilinogen deaminase n=1 Tax=Serinicoccus chungangensis TaxID=767452 RepID=A0A0W8I296_9MICO|nr:hydroxymethylbilane synthase [Serinicoccus chungangensis]KUG51781.1 hydroxymethylbilane synthase [Serinicoccus chungangensis]
MTDPGTGTTAPADATRPLRLGTRRSALATSQSGWVADRLRAAGRGVELVLVTTEGDTSRRSLTEIGGTGVFASALRGALLDGRIDLAVHSLKDLPTAPADGLVVAAVPEREDPHDVLVARDGLALRDLPPGAVVGTGSPRRAAQLGLLRPDLEVRDIRGNVDSRIRMVRDQVLDAVVLARAGLARLDRLDEATEVLGTDDMVPAAGQGALAVECRADDTGLAAELAEILDHPATRAQVSAERAALAALEAGCTAPVGALAEPGSSDERHPADDPSSATLVLHAFAALDTGAQRRVTSGAVDAPEELGRAMAALLLNRPDPTGLVAAGSHTPESDL